MSSTIANTVTGIVFLIFLWKTTMAQNQTHSCMVDEKFEIMRCSDGAIKNGMIPQNLTKSVKVLIISNNINMKVFTNSSFSNYTSLITLEMRNLSGESNASVYFIEKPFFNLTKLENLDMTGTHLPSIENITWPKSLKNLSIAGCGLSTADVHDLNKLIFFNGSHNRLEKFPKFHYLAPLYRVDLWNNSIKTMNCKDIAPYCNLTYFNISFPHPGEGIQSKKEICECKYLWYWVTKYTTNANIKLKCAENTTDTVNNSTSKCLSSNIEMEECCLKIRRLCVHRLLLKVTTLYAVIIGSIFLIGTLTLLALAYAKPVKIPKVIETHPFEAHSTTPKGSPDIDHSTSPNPSLQPSSPHP